MPYHRPSDDPVAWEEPKSRWFSCDGAQGRNRTADTGIFSPLLYRLSYLGETAKRARSLPFTRREVNRIRTRSASRHPFAVALP